MKKIRVRVTKESIKQIRDQKKITSAQHKRNIIPGPWTNKQTNIKVEASLVARQSMYKELGSFCGAYNYNREINEKGWYSIFINITFPNIKTIITDKNIDEVIAACEASLNEAKENGKKKYGDLIILDLFSNNSQKENESERFLSCEAKTNKKNITGFMAIREKKLVVLGAEENNQ